jgi:TolA-binding protein
LGLIAYNQGNRQGAISYYKQVFSHNPKKDEADAALAALREIYVKDMGDPDGYAAFLETIPGYKLDNIGRDTLAFDAAETAYENGNYERAVTGFSDYIKKYPNGVNILQAYYHRGESYYVLKQYSNALKDYEWILSKGQSRYYVDALGKAALIAYHNEKDFKKAYDLFTKWETVANNASDRFEAQMGAMRAAYRLGDVNAVQTAARKVANNPSATDAHVATAEFYLGKIAYDKKDYNAAMSSFQRVIKLSDDEQTAEARYLVASIHYLRRDLEKAKEQCLENNNESSGYPYWVGKSLLLLSDVFAEQGDLFSARTVLEALIENYENQTDDIIPTAKQKLEALKRQAAGESRLDKNLDNKFMDDGGN